MNLKWIVRDKTLQALLAVALFLVLLVPVVSSFSLHQPQELSITLSLSIVSFTLLLLTALLGATSVWRDLEKRYTNSILSLPMSRGVYLLGKFLAIALFLAGCTLFLSMIAAGAISFISVRYPSEPAVQWGRVGLAIVADLGKYVLLSALALFFSSLSTSFFLPFFGTISLFLAGSASQEVYDYVCGAYGEEIGLLAQWLVKGVYYLLPNFSAFDYKLVAIYPIPLDWLGLLYTFLYFCVYTILALSAAVSVFSRRELL